MLVIKAYNSAYPNPLRLRQNDQLRLGEKESEWPGWLWCTDQNSNSGWVPENYVRIAGDKGVMTCDYDATELTVQPGDQVTIIKEESGWYWCMDKSPRYGWLPKEYLKINE